MSGLDQAFIKAYTRPGGAPAALDNAPSSVPLADTLQEPPLPPAADLPATEVEPQFRAMLQVDSFSWPKVCRQLDETADGELNRLADGLGAAMVQGHKVLAIGGCHSSDGATTLVLCAARRLAQRGHKVVMVDANAADPKLAKRLGIIVQHGWGEVLAGQLPLGEVVVEESGGDLAVLPLSESAVGESEPDQYENRLADDLETLAAHFDLVLIDLGSLADPEMANGPLARGIARRLDAIVLVHDVRAGNGDQLAEVQRYLAASDIAQVGIIENFTANRDV